MTGTAKRKGTYLLFVTLDGPMTVNTGSLGTVSFEKGEYCYAGSAMNGLDGRIMRHFAKEKRIRWHIDRLTVISDGKEAYVSFSVPECALAEMAAESGCIPVHKGFGCSDCKCGTHLFLVSEDSKRRLLGTSGADPFLPCGHGPYRGRRLNKSHARMFTS
jgi:Uri superfamily endonuclease